MGGIGDLMISAEGPTGGLLRDQKAQEKLKQSTSEIESIANQIYELESANDAVLKSMAKQQATLDLNTLEQEARRPLTPPEKLTLLKGHYEKFKTERDTKLGAARSALYSALDKGGGQDIYDVMLTPDQNKAIEGSAPWKRTGTQALFEMARGAPLQRQGAIFAGALTPEERQQYDSLLAEEKVGRPVGTRGWAGKVISGLVAPARGAMGTVANVVGRLQKEAPATVQDVPPYREDAAVTALSSGGFTPPWLQSGSIGAQQRGHVTGVLGIDPVKAASVGGGGLASVRQGGRAFVGESDDRNSLQFAAAQGQRDMKRQALDLAKKKAAEGKIAGDKDAIIAEAVRLYHANEMTSSVDPAAMQLLGEMVLDPLPFAPGAVRVGGQIAGKIPAVQKGVAAAERVGNAIADNEKVQSFLDRVRHLNEANRMGRAQAVIPNEIPNPVAEAVGTLDELPPLVRGKEAPGLVGPQQGTDEVSSMLDRISREMEGQQVQGLRKAQAKAEEKAARLGDDTREIAKGLEDPTLTPSYMRMSEAEAQTVGQDFEKFVASKLARMEKVDEATRKSVLDSFLREGRETGMRKMLESGRPMDDALADAIAAGDELRTGMLEFKQKYGIGYRWDKDEAGQSVLRLAEDTALPNWVPRRFRNEAGEAEFQAAHQVEQMTGQGIGKTQASLHPKSALARKADEKWYEGVDPVKQFRQEAYDMRGMLPKAAEMKRTHELLTTEGLSVIKRAQIKGDKYVFDGGVTVSRKDGARALDAISKKMGVKWESSDETLSPVIQAITGKSGESDNFVFFAPKPVMQRLRALAPVMGKSPSGFVKLAQDFNRFADKSYRPYLAATKLGRTQLGLAGYLARNLASDFMIQGVNHGLAAANPGRNIDALKAAFASGGFGAEGARGVKVALRSGETVELGWVTDQMKKLGLLDQFDARTGVEGLSGISKQGRYMKAVRGVTEFGGKYSIANANRMVDNHQRIAAFLNFLSGTKTADVARALDLTSKYAGNYRRLSDVERYFLRDVFGFYSWNRYILPHLTEQLIKHPDRFSKFAMARGYMNRKYGPSNMGDVVPERFRDLGVALPGGKLGSHQYAVAMVEDPLSMLLGPLFDILGSGKNYRSAPGVGAMMSPVLQFANELFLGQDVYTKEPIVDVPWSIDEFRDSIGRQGLWRGAKASALAELLLAPASRLTREIGGMMELLDGWGNPSAAMNLKLRYKVMNDFQILGALADKIVGMSQGEKWNETRAPFAAIPGISPYAIDTQTEVARNQASIAKHARDVQYSAGK